MQAFNALMSAVRVSVEWLFGDIVNYFKFVDFKKNFSTWLCHAEERSNTWVLRACRWWASLASTRSFHWVAVNRRKLPNWPFNDLRSARSSSCSFDQDSRTQRYITWKFESTIIGSVCSFTFHRFCMGTVRTSRRKMASMYTACSLRVPGGIEKG